MSNNDNKRVEPYPESPMTRKVLEMETYEYHLPFNYENITVNRRYLRGQEWHGIEINPVNSIGADGTHYPPDNIIITEDRPIVRVVVIELPVLIAAIVDVVFVNLNMENSLHIFDDTRNVSATVEQIKRLEIVGCEIIRVAVPDEQAATALKEIKL